MKCGFRSLSFFGDQERSADLFADHAAAQLKGILPMLARQAFGQPGIARFDGLHETPMLSQELPWRAL